jgi:hypothetical protein
LGYTRYPTKGRHQMNTVIDVSNINEIVLTNNGVVVGHIQMKRLNSDIEFKGQAVNFRTRFSVLNANYDPSSNTNNGFSCGFSIDKSNADDVKIDNYLKNSLVKTGN